MRRDGIARRQGGRVYASVVAALRRKRLAVALAIGGALAASILLVVYHNYSGMPKSLRIVSTERPSVTNTAPTNVQMPYKPLEAATVVAMDLRPFITERGLTSQQINGSLHLPRKLVTLSIQLPWGSDGGRYHLSLRTGSKTVVTAEGDAKISNGLTVLIIPELDLSKPSPGQYTLAYQHRGDSSHYAIVHLGD